MDHIADWYARKVASMNRRIVMLVSFLAISLLALTASAQGISFNLLASGLLPWDAAPSPDGSTIYYTAIQEGDLPGVFSVPAAGGESRLLASGDPFVLPLALDVSSDGQTVYVADPLTAGAAGNAIYAVPTDGEGDASLVVGTHNTAPQAVTVVSEGGADQLYYSGLNPANGQPTIYKIAAAGAGDATIVAEGAPFVAPSGIAVAKDGTLYVLDRLGMGSGTGAVWRISGAHTEQIATNVRIGGQAAGIALTLDETLLFVSSLDNDAGTAQVLAINLATMDQLIVNDVIGANLAAGGLHRAHDVDTFAWADSTVPGPGRRGGSVYSVIWGT